jgi:hypothetical protein
MSSQSQAPVSFAASPRVVRQFCVCRIHHAQNITTIVADVKSRRRQDGEAERPPARPGGTRAAILAAAGRHFAHHGYDRASVRGIAATSASTRS